MAWIEILKDEAGKEKEVMHKEDGSGYALCFQHCCYHYDDETTQEGYRFIWRRDNGNLQAARGQARIPSVSILLKLVSQAMSQGWGHYNGNPQGFEFPEDAF